MTMSSKIETINLIQDIATPQAHASAGLQSIEKVQIESLRGWFDNTQLSQGARFHRIETRYFPKEYSIKPDDFVLSAGRRIIHEKGFDLVIKLLH